MQLSLSHRAVGSNLCGGMRQTLSTFCCYCSVWDGYDVIHTGDCLLQIFCHQGVRFPSGGGEGSGQKEMKPKGQRIRTNLATIRVISCLNVTSAGHTCNDDRLHCGSLCARSWEQFREGIMRENRVWLPPPYQNVRLKWAQPCYGPASRPWKHWPYLVEHARCTHKHRLSRNVGSAA
jgi:hypothetical protein